MIKVAIDRIIASDDLSQRWDEIRETTFDDRFWVVVDNGKPRFAVVDLAYLNDRVGKAWFDELSAYTHGLFRDYLIRQGLNPDEMSEEEIEAILHN